MEKDKRFWTMWTSNNNAMIEQNVNNNNKRVAIYR